MYAVPDLPERNRRIQRPRGSCLHGGFRRVEAPENELLRLLVLTTHEIDGPEDVLQAVGIPDILEFAETFVETGRDDRRQVHQGNTAFSRGSGRTNIDQGALVALQRHPHGRWIGVEDRGCHQQARYDDSTDLNCPGHLRPPPIFDDRPTVLFVGKSHRPLIELP